MANVRIITDSSILLENRHLLGDHDISVARFGLRYGDRVVKDESENPGAETPSRVLNPSGVVAPEVADFEALYATLSKQTDQIAVILSSAKLSKACDNAKAATAPYLGRCHIQVIDSRNISVGLGYLVEAAALAASAGTNLEELVRLARSVVARIYSVYYVEELDYLVRGGLLGPSQAVVGRMLDIKPLVTVEDGALITMEKARTHVQAIEKMMEFVAEFTEFERLTIVQNSTRMNDRTRVLQERLALEFEHSDFPILVYETFTASLLGPDMMGMVVLDGE